MKNLSLICVLIFSSILCFGQNTKKESSEDYTIDNVLESSIPKGIQDEIMKSFVASFITNDNADLIRITNALSMEYSHNKNNLFIYWKSYAQYYNSIFYLKKGDVKKAEELIDISIKDLNKLERKNSEDYALLSLIQSFSLQFKKFPQIISANREVAKNIAKAISMDDKNPRAYFVYASNDYYTPTQYGGGKKAEEYLLKAIGLPEQKNKNDFLPSWGKEEAYDLLIEIYINKNDLSNAKKYLKIGLKEFPESYTLKSKLAKIFEKE